VWADLWLRITYEGNAGILAALPQRVMSSVFSEEFQIVQKLTKRYRVMHKE